MGAVIELGILPEAPEWAMRATSGDGDGDGGYGYGYGDGDGDGGYGYGDGDGDGGYGDGYGDGDGDGDSYGSKAYWAATIGWFASKWPEAQRERLRELQESGAKIAFWRSDSEGRACNSGKNDPVKPGTVERTKGPLRLCESGVLHATLLPPKWRGGRWWIVALIGEVAEDENKLGALHREIIGECT